MSFRLFGIKVEIQMSFWITGVLLGLIKPPDPDVSRGAAVAVWVIVVFVSVLVHELGHAFAVKHYRIEPAITLYAMGGLTRFQATSTLRRRDQVLISLAGPFAGFALGGLVLAAMRLAPRFFMGLSPVMLFAVDRLLLVNFFWGIINLLPVLPFDGGHVLEHALGPKRTQLTAAISTLVGFLVAAFFLHLRAVWGAVLFGLAAVQSYRRFASAGEGEAGEAGEKAEEPAEPDPSGAERTALLRSARRALGEDDLERAAAIAQQVLEGPVGPLPSRPSEVPPAARCEALEVIAWTHLLSGRLDTAAEVLAEVRRIVEASAGESPGQVDAGLEGALLFAREDFAGARRVLEAARARGDDRQQVVGPLVQILVAQGEVARAAEVVLAVVDTISADDARRMAELAVEHGAFAPAARLYEAMFDRLHRPDDAYEAARAEAQGGRPERALQLLRRAVDAGFSDRARAWSDTALATLQATLTPEGGAARPPALEAVLPRP